MTPTFLDKLSALMEDACDCIRSITQQKKIITIFQESNDGEDDWTKDIYSEVPSFLYHFKYGYSEEAAIKEIHCDDNEIQ